MVKKICSCSKNIEHCQNVFENCHNIFEVADGIGISAIQVLAWPQKIGLAQNIFALS